MEVFVRGARSISPSDVAVTYITDRCRMLTVPCKEYSESPVLQIASALGRLNIGLFRFYTLQMDEMVFLPNIEPRRFNVRVRHGSWHAVIDVEYKNGEFFFVDFIGDATCLCEITMPCTPHEDITREDAASYAMCCIVAGTEFADLSRYGGILMPLAARMIASMPDTQLQPFIVDPAQRKCGQYIVGAHYSMYTSGAFYVDIKAAYPSALSSIHDDNPSLAPIADIYKAMFALRSDPRLTAVKRISNVTTGYLRCGMERHNFPLEVAGFFNDLYFTMTQIVRRQIMYLLGPICPIFCYVDSICVQKKDAKDIQLRMASTSLTFSTQEYKRVYVVKPSEYIVETSSGEFIVKGCSHEAKKVMQSLLVDSNMFDKPLAILPASISDSLARYHHTLSHAKSSSAIIFCPFMRETTPRPLFGRLKSCPLCHISFHI